MDQETNRQSVLDTLMSPAAIMTADATIAIIAEEGFDRVSVRSVAARLGVAPGTVQYRSPSRRTLLTDALIRSVQRQAGRVVSHEVAPAQPETFVRALAELLPIGAVQREDAAAWVAFGAAASTRPWLADPYWEALQIMRTLGRGCSGGCAEGRSYARGPVTRRGGAPGDRPRQWAGPRPAQRPANGV